MGGRQSNGTYQYTLKSDNTADLKTWATKLADAMAGRPALDQVDTDQQDNGVEVYVDIDRDQAARLGVSLRDVDNALYNAFGQRQVATIYEDINQYTVVMEVAAPPTPRARRPSATSMCRQRHPAAAPHRARPGRARCSLPGPQGRRRL